MSDTENFTSIFKSFRFSSLDETNFNSNTEKSPSNEDNTTLLDPTDYGNEEHEQIEVSNPTDYGNEEHEQIEVSNPTDYGNEEHEQIEVSNPTDYGNEEHEQIEVSNPTDYGNEEHEQIEVSDSDLKTIVKPVRDDIINVIDNQSKSFLIIVFNIEEINNISKTLTIFNSIYDTVYLNSSNTHQCKWSSVSKYLNENDSWKNYKFIWIPDCNIDILNDKIVSFFQITESLNQDITQPSLKKSSDSSIYTHKVLLNQTNSKTRKTPFIENKMPCFKVDFVNNYLVSFLNTNYKYITSGWGIDLWWSTIAKHLSIVDAIEVKDTSIPINKSIGSKEMKYLIKKYKLKLSILIKK